MAAAYLVLQPRQSLPWKPKISCTNCHKLNIVAGTTYTALDFVGFQAVDGTVKSVQSVVHVEHRSQGGTIQTHPMLSGSMR